MMRFKYYFNVELFLQVSAEDLKKNKLKFSLINRIV